MTIDDVPYEIAHFDTKPYETVEEFRSYRDKKKLTVVLRTVSDWDIFWQKVDYSTSGCKIKDKDWAILFSCVMGYRAKRWDFPALEGKTTSEKIDWFNAHNDSKTKLNMSSWKNARRPERQVNMLPVEVLKEKLSELGCVFSPASTVKK